MRSRTVLVGPVSAAVVAAVLGAMLLTGFGREQTAGTVVRPPFEVAATSLTDTAGTPLSLTEDGSRPLTLLIFGYTLCPACPQVMQTLTAALNELSEDERGQVRLVFVSTDPATDTPEVLRAYLDRFDPSYVGARGDLDRVAALARSVGIFVPSARQLERGGYDLSLRYVTAVDADGRAPMFWRQDISAAQFAYDISTLLEDR